MVLNVLQYFHVQFKKKKVFPNASVFTLASDLLRKSGKTEFPKIIRSFFKSYYSSSFLDDSYICSVVKLIMALASYLPFLKLSFCAKY